MKNDTHGPLYCFWWTAVEKSLNMDINSSYCCTIFPYYSRFVCYNVFAVLLRPSLYFLQWFKWIDSKSKEDRPFVLPSVDRISIIWPDLIKICSPAKLSHLLFNDQCPCSSNSEGDATYLSLYLSVPSFMLFTNLRMTASPIPIPLFLNTSFCF